MYLMINIGEITQEGLVNIICWKWEPLPSYRSKFEALHVNVLYAMLKRNITLPFRFSCITDNAEGIDPKVNIIPLWDEFKDIKNPNKQLSPSCYRRLKVFSNEAKELIGKRILSIDLDVVITGNIDSLLSRQEDFICMHGTARNTAYNGGLWMLKAGTRPKVYDTFDPQTSPQISRQNGHIGSDQGWISYVLGNKEKTWSEKDGIYCFRTNLLSGKKKLTSKPLPDNTKIVMFSGRNDPWDLFHIDWIREHYRIDEPFPAPPKPVIKPRPIIIPAPKPKPKPKPKPINCITFFWGPGPYFPDYVNKLFNMIDRHLHLPHKNICFTNTPTGIRNGIEIRPLHNEWMKGNLKKAIQFDPDNNFEGRVLSFDLDNVIISSIDEFATMKGEFIICPAISPKRKGLNAGNLMAFTGGYGKELWQELNKNYKKYEFETNGSERFLYDKLIPSMSFWPKHTIVSYKKHVKTRKVTDWSKVKMVWLHGSPKPHEVNTKRIISNWK